MSVSATSKMKIDILAHYKEKELFESLPILKQFKQMVSYERSEENKIPKNLVIAYVIILYSVDSVLNRQPMPSLDQRQSMAVELIDGLKVDDVVKNDLFELNNERVFTMAFEYLMYQNNESYQLMVAKETLRLRTLKDMMTITANTSTKDLQDKARLGVIVKQYNDEIELMKMDIFGDHKKLADRGKEKIWGDTIETII